MHLSTVGTASVTTIDVIIPTYRRALLLERCLAAVAAQDRPADRVLVVVRESDAASLRVVDLFEGLPGLGFVKVGEPGVLAAMAAGVRCSTSEVIAFTDDDAAPRPGWLSGLLAHFADPTIGAVGGRDVIRGQETPLTELVGRFRPSGRLVGNHHLGAGRARDVDVLKGVNMAFRVAALALPAPGVLRGSGAQVDFEVMTCAFARRRGWRIVYDPSVLVDHEAGPRHGPDRRLRPDSAAVLDAAFNSVVASSALEPWTIPIRAGYGIALGTRDRPGLVRAAMAVVRREPDVVRRFGPAIAGRGLALVSLLLRWPVGRGGPLLKTAAQLRGGEASRPAVTLVAHDVHDGGGMERAFAELIRWSCSSFDITVVSATLAPDLRPLVAWRRVRVPSRPFFVKFVTFFVRAGIATKRTDGALTHALGAIVPNRVDLATVQYCHRGQVAATGRLAPAGAPLMRRTNTLVARSAALLAERWCYRPQRVRALAAVSEGVRDEIQTHYPEVRVLMTPNGVDLERFGPDSAVRANIRAAMGTTNGQCVALFVGGDWDRKGLDLAIRAVSKLKAQAVDLELWVVGPGDEARFTALAAELGVMESVFFFGRRDDTERFYKAADVFLLPSAYETFSIVCFEAAACGLPIVIPPLSGASDLVGRDEGGVIVKREVDSIAAALRPLCEDPSLRKRMGSEAQRRAADYTWDESAASVAKAYHELLEVPRA